MALKPAKPVLAAEMAVIPARAVNVTRAARVAIHG
jgi:hypothetical protein